METTIKSNQSRNSVSSEKMTSNKAVAFWEMLEFNRFGIISMLVAFLGCVGGMGASFGAGDNTLKLAIIAYPTIISLALILAGAKMKAIVYLSAVAIAVDLIILAF